MKSPPAPSLPRYRGRLAPSPTGYLHLGHARTFWMAQQRAQEQAGALVLRVEDLDFQRCKPAFTSALLDDLRWFGFRWQEGPDCGGPLGPYSQSERFASYLSAFHRLVDRGFLYPCTCSRKEIQRVLQAPHPDEEDEPIYPGTCRDQVPLEVSAPAPRPANPRPPIENPTSNWRFRVPDGEVISFVDGHLGPQRFKAGKDFGDFVVWRHDHLPAYQLAVVVDDAAMKITEVVRGADLLRSTARQLLLYRALGFEPPMFFHCDLLRDETGQRLAKRHDALSLRALRQRGTTPEALRLAWL